jgi:hypothetical protein
MALRDRALRASQPETGAERLRDTFPSASDMERDVVRHPPLPRASITYVACTCTGTVAAAEA